MSIQPGGQTPDQPDFGGMPGFEGLLQQASQMQERMMSAQAELGDKRVTGDAGGGLVTAEVDGTGELVGLTIQPEACDPTDTETLADLVVAAVRSATANAHDAAREQMQAAAGLGDLGDLGGLFGGAAGGPDQSPEETGDGPDGGVGFRP